MVTLSPRRFTHKLRLAAVIGTCFGLLTAICSCATSGQDIEPKFTRSSGSEFTKGSQKLDVPYVVTHQAVVKAMLDLAGVKPDEFLIDLGSGDGRINIIAAKNYGALGFGKGNIIEGTVLLSGAIAPEQLEWQAVRIKD